MSFRENSTQQVSLFDSTANLTEREKKMLDRSWAKYFAECIFPEIDEKPFRVLFSDRPSRANTPINVIIGALIIKEMFGLTDEEMVETLPFDIRFQYALHTSSFDEQPLNDRTLGRFRARCNAYEEQTGIDLIHDCIIRLSGKMAKMMKLNTGLRRMDSLMVASNIKKMSRLELIYTCVANLVHLMNRKDDDAIPESVKHYLLDSDHNNVLYYTRSEDTDSKISTVLKDAALLITVCGSRYDDASEYQLLIRVLNEQTERDDRGNYILRTKGMDSKTLQNPADPDATYREKAGEKHRGYIANVVEETNGESSLTVDYQYEQNIYSDSQFLKDYIERQSGKDGRITLVTDGGYCGNDNAKLSRQKDITLVTTNLKGADVADIWADFQFSDDGRKILSCPAGHIPKSNVYDCNTQKCKASFPIKICADCPKQGECNPVMHKRVATIKVAQRTAFHADQQRFLKTEEFKKLAYFRNGVETVPAVLRKRHKIDKMPVRGYIKTKLYFGFKVAAMNVRKLVQYLQMEQCAQNPLNA